MIFFSSKKILIIWFALRKNVDFRNNNIDIIYILYKNLPKNLGKCCINPK